MEAMDEDDESSDEEMETGKGQGHSGKGHAKAVKHDIIMKGGAAASSQVAGLEDQAAAVKGVAKQGFFKSTKSKFLMFPFHEEKLRWDDYGEIIKPEDWIDTSMDASAANAAATTDNAEDKDDADANGTKDGVGGGAQEVPTKCVSTMTKIQIKAQVAFIDFEGRSDGESIHKIIAKMKPRRVIIVRGTHEDS